MSIISKLDEDRSDIVCKLYAEQTLDFLSNSAAIDDTAKVPLGNLFRLFEMYRYDAFDDERRSGVLALAEFSKPDHQQPEPWYAHIKQALDKATNIAFGANSREVTVEELQSMLRNLASSNVTAQTPNIDKHKAFYREFSAALPA